MLAIVFSIWHATTVQALNLVNCNHNSQFQESANLVHQVAIIGEDNREIRKPGSSSGDIEKAQGRVYCIDKPSNKKNTLPQISKADILKQKPIVANATIALENDVIILNRHIFIESDGRTIAKFENCYFEHIFSGQIIPLVDAEFPPLLASKHPRDRGHRDFAVARLKTKPKDSSAIPKDMIVIDGGPDFSAPIKVISNYAMNTKNRESLTMTTCKRYGIYDLSSGAQSTNIGTDCDTGGGSSGAQAYIEVGGEPKLFGIVSGELKKVPERGSFDPQKLSTSITMFDESLFESYQRLKGRSSI
ncbi:MAG: hypothetical protein KF799_04355 [Bdellovibrionales bacterium]|nr:hypothetical protein [Bdellovibrionales bacterium]